MIQEIEHRDYTATLWRCAELGGARFILTSPPYLDSRVSGEYGFDSPPWTLDDYKRLGISVRDALTPGGVVALNVFGRVAEWRQGFGTERSTDWMRIALLWQELGLRYIECYAYCALGPPGAFGPRHRKGWEPVHVFAKIGADVYFDRHAATRPAATVGRRYGRSRHRDSTGWSVGGPGFTQESEACLDTAIAASPCSSHGHPAPFSPYLANVFVASYTQIGDIVCDPFTGSGTVAVAAAQQMRQFVGGDLGHRLDPPARWADIARARMLEGV